MNSTASGIVVLDPLGDGLEHHGLAGLGGGHDHRPLSLAEGTDQVDHPGGVVDRAAAARDLEPEHLVGMDGGEPGELGAIGEQGHVHAVDAC